MCIAHINTFVPLQEFPGHSVGKIGQKVSLQSLDFSIVKHSSVKCVCANQVTLVAVTFSTKVERSEWMKN